MFISADCTLPRHLLRLIPISVSAGIVNLVGNYLTLPPGTQHSFLGLAFSIEGAVMVMHTKHHPLDAVVHWLLGMTMLTTAAFVFLEIKAPHSLLVSVARSGSLMLTGAWLCVMGKMLYTGVCWSLLLSAGCPDASVAFCCVHSVCVADFAAVSLVGVVQQCSTTAQHCIKMPCSLQVFSTVKSMD